MIERSEYSIHIMGECVSFPHTFTFTPLTMLVCMLWPGQCVEPGLGWGQSIITPDLQTRRLKPDTDLLTSRTWSQGVHHVSNEMSRVFCVGEIARERERAKYSCFFIGKC